MIWESSYWKRDLLRRAARLRRRTEQARWPEASLASVEQDVMLIAYSIRKLVEAGKVSSGTAKAKVHVRSLPARGTVVTALNWHRLDEHFDVTSRASRTIATKFLCDQLIHSYVFVLDAGAEGLAGFYVASDEYRHTRLLYVPIGRFLDLVERVGSDSLDSVHSRPPDPGDD